MCVDIYVCVYVHMHTYTQTHTTDILFINSLRDTGYFHVLATINSTAKNMKVWASFGVGVFISFGYIL